MSDAIFTQKANGMAIKNTALQSAFERDGTRCFLLKRSQQSKVFESVVELTSGFRGKFANQLREELFLFYSTIEDFVDTWGQVTHIAYGVPVDNELFVYEIQPDQKERVPPDASNHYWKAFAVRMKNERHTIVETNYLTYNGDRLTYNGDYLTYNP